MELYADSVVRALDSWNLQIYDWAIPESFQSHTDPLYCCVPRASALHIIENYISREMDNIFPVAGDAVCAKCSRPVWISVVDDAYNFNAPMLNSDCVDANCPINEANRPNDTQIVTIGFADDGS